MDREPHATDPVWTVIIIIVIISVIFSGGATVILCMIAGAIWGIVILIREWKNNRNDSNK